MAIPLLLGLAARFIVPTLADKLVGKVAEKWGDKVGDIAKQITGALTPEEAHEKLQADPNKQAEFAAKVASESIQFENELLKDRQDARARDVSLARLGKTNYRADAITALTYVLLIACICLSVFNPEMSEWVKTMINMTATFCIAKLGSVFDFEFGSSKGSRDKDEISLMRHRQGDK